MGEYNNNKQARTLPERVCELEKKVEAIQSKSQSLRVGWRTFVFGSGNQSMPSGEIFQYSPSSARMKTSFNDYVFTEQDATEYFKKQLNL